jgi:putative acetyltransferase
MNDSTLANVRIRDATSFDAQDIRLIHLSAFDTAAEANLVDMLREGGKTTISLVAEIDDQIVGHILFSPVSIEPTDSAWLFLGLAPVVVIPEKQGQGSGRHW